MKELSAFKIVHIYISHASTGFCNFSLILKLCLQNSTKNKRFFRSFQGLDPPSLNSVFLIFFRQTKTIETLQLFVHRCIKKVDKLKSW